MSDELSSIDDLILVAREQSAALGVLMQRYHGYLRLIAEQEIGARLGRRVDASDVVQQTFMKAHRDFQRFHGSSEPQLSAWLLRILRNNVADLVREHVLTDKRAVGKEVSFDHADASASVSWFEPAAVQSTPSQRIIRGELAIRLAQVVDSLPPDQRTAVQLRHLEGWSPDDIAAYMGRSPSAIAGLIKRGLAALREKMSEQSWM